ncbi:FAD-dependent oxidoreductase [Arthrobacter castelli]|uniref:NAD(P)/FAD-dependent oxidoreductase n=1 Tax=Arthrobacter castelli TaxID=271431 RepID=UPI0012DF7898
MLTPGSSFYMHPDFRLLSWLATLHRCITPPKGPYPDQAITGTGPPQPQSTLPICQDRLRHRIPKKRFHGCIPDRKEFDQSIRNMLADNIREQVRPADEARALEPRLGEVAGAIHRPDEAQCGTQEFVRATLAAAERHGPTIVWNTQVQRLHVTTRRITAPETVNGQFTAETYVVAAGLGSQRLCRSAGLRMPLQGAKGYVVDLHAPHGAPQLPILFKELKVVATPYPDRLRPSGNLELGSGAKTKSTGRIRAIREAGIRGLPHLDTQRAFQTWAGQRLCTADEAPVLGRSAPYPTLSSPRVTECGGWCLPLLQVSWSHKVCRKPRQPYMKRPSRGTLRSQRTG